MEKKDFRWKMFASQWALQKSAYVNVNDVFFGYRVPLAGTSPAPLHMLRERLDAASLERITTLGDLLI